MSERRLIPLANIKEEPVTWLWEGRIPLGCETILEGDPAQGKSAVANDLIARCTRGIAMPGCSSAIGPAGAVLLQGEDFVQSVRCNLETAGADIERIRVYDRSVFRERPLILPADVDILANALAEVQAKLLVIDPINAFLAANTCFDGSVRRALQPLRDLAEKAGVALLLVRHLAKSARGNALYRGAGSIAFIASARSALLVAPDPTCDEPHRHVLALNKSNLSQAPSLAYRTVKKNDAITIEWLGEAKLTAGDLVGTAKGQQTALVDAAYVLHSILSHGPRWAEDVKKLARRAGVSERTLRRAKDLIRIKSRRRGGGPGSRWLWEPADPNFLAQLFGDRELDDLMDDLIHGHLDPPFAEHDGSHRFGPDGEQECHS